MIINNHPTNDMEKIIVSIPEITRLVLRTKFARKVSK